MKQVYMIDAEGYYIEPIILFPRTEEQEVTVTPETYVDEQNNVITPEPYMEMRTIEVYDVPENCVAVQPPSYYRAQWQNNNWHESGQKPVQEEQPLTTEEKLAILEKDNEGLKSSVAFLEDMIVILTMP